MGWKVDPLTIPLAVFLALPAEDKEALRQQVITLSRRLVKKFLIDDENYWILVCSSTAAIRAAAKVEDRVYPADIIEEFEGRMGHPAYGIFRHEVLLKEGK